MSDYSLEEQAAIAIFKIKIDNASDQQLRDIATMLYEQTIAMKKTYEKMIATEWGIFNNGQDEAK